MFKSVCRSSVEKVWGHAYWAVLTTILALACPTVADEQVVFKDANLKAAVEERLGVADPTPANMLRLSSLYANSLGVTDLTGLEYATNLGILDLDDNQIADISLLAGLPRLVYLFLSNNQITDISALAGLKFLTLISLDNNQVTSLGPLIGLTRMTYLYVLDNPLNRAAYCQDLQTLETDNPGLTLAFGLNANPPGGVSASDGTYTDKTEITWEPLCAGPSITTFTYRVSRSNGLDGEKQAISGWIAETSFEDTSAASCVKYTYWLESGYSAEYSHPDEGWRNEQNIPLTVSSGGDGSATGSGGYDCGSIVPIAAAPSANYHFVNWTTKGLVNVADAVSANTTVTVNGEGSVTANFGPNTDLLVDTLPVLSHTITSASAILRGRITGDWRNSDCLFYFEVFKKTNPSTQGLYTDQKSIKTVEGKAEFAQLLEGLEPQCTYVYRAYASNSHESDEGEAIEFATDPLSPLDILYVDDNAISDPGPNDLTVGDPEEDGSHEHPFDSIQQAIDAAREHVTVLVSQGRYTERLNFRGKTLEVNGFEPSHQAMTQYPIIDAMDQGVVVTFDQGEEADCSLSGFVLTRGIGDRGAAIACIDSSPTIRNCLVVGNRCLEGQDPIESAQGAIYCENSNSLFENCTIADNYGGQNGSGICVIDCHIVLSQAIVWDNWPAQIHVVSGNEPIVLSSCLDEDPLFALPGYWTDVEASTLVAIEPGDPRAIWLEGDYHVRSLHGRYDHFANDWAYDELTSDCIDLGDASESVGFETAPHGDRVNAGAYGGSWMASRTGEIVFVSISDPGFTGEMSKYEITNAQYCRFLNETLFDGLIMVYHNRVYGASDASHAGPFFETYAASMDSQITYMNGEFSVRMRDGHNMVNHPVVEVSWYGATAFGIYYGYKLPTSEQWKAVADYDGTFTYGCGTSIDPNYANYGEANPLGLTSHPYTSPVGYYPAFGYGLCDMAGSVWEWTSSVSGNFLTLRSGDWSSLDVFSTVTSRSAHPPDYTASSIGFRVYR